MRGKGIFIFVLLLFYSCYEFIDDEFGSPPTRLVVVSFFSPDSVFSVRVSRVVGLNEFTASYDTIVWIDDAVCSLFVDGGFLEVLQDTGSGVYVSPSGYKPQVGKRYQLKVYHSDFPSVSAESYVPDSVPIVSVFKKDSALIEGDEMGRYPLSLLKTTLYNDLDSVQYLEFYLTQYWFYRRDASK